ncbi:hypothetical protein V8E54_012138 [Elaphomyces granulatus]
MFPLRVFVLLVILSSAAAEYDIRDCDYEQTTWVKGVLDEIILLAGRAASTLREALDTQTGIPPHVLRILYTFLPNSDVDTVTYEKIWEMYKTIADGLADSNIRYFCKDPSRHSSEGDSFYPIDMARVNGQPHHHDMCGDNFLEGNYYIFMDEPISALTDFATTITSTPGSLAFVEQVRCTGSTTRWSDVVMGRILSEVKEGSPATFSALPWAIDWSQVANPLYRPITMTSIVLHEIIHSVGVPDPNPDHSKTTFLDDANSLLEVISNPRSLTPSAVNPRPLYQNPGTAAWLCVSLAMPGYRLKKDATLEPNIVNRESWFPLWVSGGKPITSSMYYQIMREGPFYGVLAS